MCSALSPRCTNINKKHKKRVRKIRLPEIISLSPAQSSCIPLNNLWAADNIAGHYKRAVSCGTIQLTGNISGAIIGFIFTSQSAPRYRKGIYFDIAATVMSMCCTIVLLLGTRAKISKKAKQVAAGAPDDNSLGDENPHYKLFL
ncbi:hypothetical protein L198_01612 [Cryptococcus wingfieldii CBS 7118]|uniref:Major facilitator superfamily (MFS) profile domain-containing protein n=1 Tax=Cryptococcus wingfieldii CBS 7118 TaxID=1295528 RepID=A0A1E3JZW3_9TREE|nr:hypothetical protein L198_01612 [Cryptococcus wingfieldii CBS 7118]ODO06380.1 hypothetical protein L198_01612 [Cryptococcus wingfieldii CBS 7118]